MTKPPKELDSVSRKVLTYKDPAAPLGERMGAFNSLNDARLTKSGGMDFDLWVYILKLEMQSPCDWTPKIKKNNDWIDYYENDFTPHGAIEEDFNAGGEND